jgi:periplasmic protein TonB
MALYDAHEMRIASAAVSHVASRYQAPRARWASFAVIAGLHVAAVATLDMVGVLPVRRLPSELKVIALSAEAMPPPPVVEPKPKDPPPAEVKLSTTPVPVAPTVQASTPPVAVAAANPLVAAPAPVVAPPPPPAAAPQGPMQVSDLDARAITIVPPKYPLESRRRREQGTVLLNVTLDAEGAIASVALARSSGFERLDKAALEAVRRWRWSPTVRGGEAVAVRGVVEIPFELTG